MSKINQVIKELFTTTIFIYNNPFLQNLFFFFINYPQINNLIF